MLTFTKKNSNDSVLNDHHDFAETPLATQSLLLILILVHHWTTQSNPYRTSLFSCSNSQGNYSLPKMFDLFSSFLSIALTYFST